MDKEKHFTKKEHFIPQTYLRAFSVEQSDSHKGKNLFQIDLKNDLRCSKVPIDSIAYQNDLYEIKDGEAYIRRNEVERNLRDSEAAFACFFQQIQKQCAVKENFDTNAFFSTYEKKFLAFYIALQKARLPDSLSSAKTIFQKEVQIENDVELQEYVLEHCFALGLEKNNSAITFLRYTASQFYRYPICVGYDPTGSIFTSDRPVVISGYRLTNAEKAIFDFDFLLFPLSPHCVIIYGNEQQFPKECRNRLFEINPDFLSRIKEQVILSADRWLYFSKKPPLPMIRDILKKKNKNS